VRRLLVLACAIVFVDTTFYAAITPLLPRFEDQFALSKSAAGVLVAAYPAGTLLGAIPGGYLAARAGVRATVVLGLALLVASRCWTRRASCRGSAAPRRGRARWRGSPARRHASGAVK
jgi:fucose permease